MTANKHTPMVVAAARALCRRNSDLCNVDFDDNWKLYGGDFLMDAQVALESAAAPELLEALHRLLHHADHSEGCGDSDSYNNAGVPTCGCGLDSATEFAHEAIAKATGGAA